MNGLQALLGGKKTYIVVILGVLVYGSEAMGLIDSGTATKLEGVLGFLGLGVRILFHLGSGRWRWLIHRRSYFLDGRR